MGQNERLLLLENTAQRTKRWIGLHLRGTPPNRDALGARIEVRTGGPVTSAESRAGGSYLCGNDPRLLFSFPAGEAPDRSRVIPGRVNE